MLGQRWEPGEGVQGRRLPECEGLVVVPRHGAKGFAGARSGQGRFSGGSALCTAYPSLLQAMESSCSVEFSDTPQGWGILRSVLSSCC